ncbi:MAG: hypothetical protein WBF84_01060 [Castellaniella sp.]|uniref:hypothetical protein n=1 Tax=Castellaniella sp. TaxID=1955812 RepID=UPI003C76F410
MYATQTPNLLSDALERAYSQSILNASQPLSLSKIARRLGRTLGRAATATGRFIADAINAQAEARARAMDYTRTPW